MQLPDILRNYYQREADRNGRTLDEQLLLVLAHYRIDVERSRIYARHWSMNGTHDYATFQREIEALIGKTPDDYHHKLDKLWEMKQDRLKMQADDFGPYES